MKSCIFCKIINGELDSFQVYADDQCIVILDINPITPGHCLVIPKEHVESAAQMDPDLFLHLCRISQLVSIASQKTLVDVYGGDSPCAGVNTIINDGRAAGQQVKHAHIHVVPRFIHDSFKFSYAHIKLTNEQNVSYCTKLRSLF